MKVRCFLGLFIGAAAFVGSASQTHAGPFRNARPQVRTQSNATVQTARPVMQHATAGVAQAKADMQSRQGVMRHVGGSMGAGRYEGVGFSSVSADDAIRRCCYWGQKTPIEIGVSRGANGWYATVIYQ
jgi:hypothetical protein